MPLVKFSAAPSREQIDRLEGELRQLPQGVFPVDHHFTPGMYVRTIHVPAGSLITGKVHSTEHVFLLVKGAMTLVTEEGNAYVEAPFQTIARAGIKRVGYAHADCVCVNVHVTDETDLAKLEAALIEAPALEANKQEALQ